MAEIAQGKRRGCCCFFSHLSAQKAKAGAKRRAYHYSGRQGSSGLHTARRIP